MVGVIAGGLVGQHGILANDIELPNIAGSITNSSANVTVTVGNGDASCPGSCMFNAAGGLVGVNVGGSSIANSHATGNVSGGARHLGRRPRRPERFLHSTGAFGTITNSCATGNVTRDRRHSAAGGLVGSNAPGSTITGSYHQTGTITRLLRRDDRRPGRREPRRRSQRPRRAGRVTLARAARPTALPADSSAKTTAPFPVRRRPARYRAPTATSRSAALPASTSGSIANSYATGQRHRDRSDARDARRICRRQCRRDHRVARDRKRTATNAAVAFAGGFVGLNFGQIELSYATGNVSAGDDSFAGGFVGFNFGEINQAYCNRRRDRRAPTACRRLRRRQRRLRVPHARSALRRRQAVELRLRLDHAVLCARSGDRRQRRGRRAASPRSILDRWIRSMASGACKAAPAARSAASSASNNLPSTPAESGSSTARSRRCRPAPPPIRTGTCRPPPCSPARAAPA